MNIPSNITIGQVLRLHAWLDNASTTADPSDAPANKIPELPADDAQAILAWWAHCHGRVPADPLARTYLLSKGIALALGCLTGVTVTSVALTYTGAHPVNLLVLLGVVVALPAIGLILTLLWHAITSRKTGSLSGMMRWAVQQLEPSLAEHVDIHMWRYGSAFYWTTQRYFQLFSLAFLSTALLTLLSVITFSDVAFGWSSTLNISTANIFAITQTLSLPWQSWLPLAHPSQELVEASRFYRMNTHNNPALLGQWWPFVAMCILVWGILPRLIMLLVTQRRLRWHTQRALLNHPEVTATLHHLRTTTVGYEADITTLPSSDEVSPTTGQAPARAADATIYWNTTAPDPNTTSLELSAATPAKEYSKLLAALPTTPDLLHIVVKGWEPPVLEFGDFVQAVRAATDPGTSIAIQALALPDEALPEHALQAWRAAVNRLQDAKVFVEPAT